MKRISLDENWKFYAETENEAPFRTVSYKNQEASGYASRHFNATGWKTVTLPHDWAIAMPYCAEAEQRHGHRLTTPIELIGQVPGEPLMRHVPTVGWYRKSFHVPSEWTDKRVFVEFDGIYRDSRVWINGQYVDRHAGGYTGFRYDLTDNLYFGQENVLAVAADSRELEGWWYEGAGIYRHARLLVCEPLHLDVLELCVTADMLGNLTVDGALINDGSNEQSCEVVIELFAPDQTPVFSQRISTTCAGWSKARFSLQKTVTDPLLWSPEQPNLYRLTLKAECKGKLLDEEGLNVGFRTFRFDADEGLFVNEKPVKIKGVCVHQDFAGVGVALPDELHEYKIRRLKEMGVNAYRSSHHAPAPEIVDACDRLGMLLMDETRMFGSTPDALRDVEALVRRDRNHACVLMWSMGNEEHSVQSTSVGARIARTVMRVIRQLDQVNYISYGGNNGPDYEGINAEAELRGVNYVHIRTEDFVDEYHKNHPHQPIFGSEEASIVMARGEYRGTDAYADAYGEQSMPWGSTAEGWWKYYMERPFLCGGFMWTGFDYNGEPSPYPRNSLTSFGAMDLCGYPKDVYYYYQAWWTDRNVLHLFPHWNWDVGETVRVVVYSNLESVELLLNGRSLGRQVMEQYGHLEWQVPFEPGTLEAVGYRNGVEVMRTERKTAQAAARIVLEAEEAVAGGEIALVKVALQDGNGNPVDFACKELDFTISGEGELLGLGNGDPASQENDQYPDRQIRREVLNWTRTDEKGTRRWDAFVPRSYEHYLYYDVDDKLERTSNKEPFRDAYRIIRSGEKPAVSVHFETEIRVEDTEFTHLDFARLEGNHEVRLNGELIGKGNAKGWPCSFEITLKPGINRLEVDCTDNGAPGGIYRGVWLSKYRKTVWKRSTFNGLAMAVVRKKGKTVLTVSGEGLKSAKIRL